MSEERSNFGIKATGDAINWRTINSNHNEDPVITDLMKEGIAFINKIDSIENSKKNDTLNFNILIDNFNIFLKDSKLPIVFQSNEKIIETNDKSKKKEKKLTSKELLLKKINHSHVFSS